jgi:ABC-type multidrug transport system permease subunit
MHEDSTQPPACPQLSWPKLLRMSFGNVLHHLVASVLQVATIAATGAFVAFVLGEIIVNRAARHFPGAIEAPGGQMAQLYWMLAIALLVCTISNVTSMLLSVTKRFRQIGTMKCLGAFDESVLRLFLMEALLLGGVGALAGAVLGTAFSLVAGLVQHGSAVATGGIVAEFFGAAVLTTVVVMVLSLIGAAYPAWQASRMLPVEAMRRV